MSDTPALSSSNGPVPPPSRPVSLFTTLFLLAIFAAFLLVIRYFYQPTTTPAFVGQPDNFAKDQQWRADRDSRQKALQELHETETKKVTTYGWVDQKAGVVQLPIDRAIELTVRDLAAKQSKQSNPQAPRGSATK